ncbi:MAG: hypothetical protein LBS79_09645 [Tannerella sp.]|jgi:hypothetical protein|nr:hypothetical protein [Tannerella sp.]
MLLTNCTTKYSEPYSAKNVAGNLSRKYAAEIEIIEIKKTKTFDKRKYNEYILKDKNRGFLFEAGSYITTDRHLLLYYKERWDHYSLGLMRYYHDDVMRIADKHGIRLIPPLLKTPDSYAKTHISVWPADSTFIHSPEQLDAIVDLYAELAHFYNFNYVRYHKNESNNPKLILNYLPANETDRSKSVRICHLLYLEYRIGDNTANPASFLKRDKYVDYIPEKNEVRKKLFQSWNNAVDEGRIAGEKMKTDTVSIF